MVMPYCEATDVELIHASQSGDRAAFHELYVRHVDAVLRYTARHAPHHLAEDLTADTFVRAWTNLPGYEWRGIPFQVWLYRIAQNLLASHGRRRRPELVADLRGELEATLPTRAGDPAGDSEVERSVLGDIAHSDVVEALRLLPDRQQRVLELRFVHDLPVPDVATQLELSEDGVRALTYRALTSIRQQVVVDLRADALPNEGAAKQTDVCPDQQSDVQPDELLDGQAGAVIP